MRLLLVTREGATKDRTRAINELKAAVVTAPEPLRARLGGLDGRTLINRCVRLRHRTGEGVAERVTVDCLRRLAARIVCLYVEIDVHTADLEALTAQHCPQLLDEVGIGPVVAAEIYIAWSHPGRCRNDAAFASLAGTAPVPVLVWVDHPLPAQPRRRPPAQPGDPHHRGHPHLPRPRHQGLRRTRRRERQDPPRARRCLKRYIARRLYKLLENPPQHLTS